MIKYGNRVNMSLGYRQKRLEDGNWIDWNQRLAPFSWLKIDEKRKVST